MQFRLETLIEAPPAVVFAAVVDIPRWHELITAITKIEMLSQGAVAVGTRFRETRLMFGRAASEEMTVALIEPARRFVLTAENHGTAYRVEHLLEPAGDGTRLILVFEGRPMTLAARLLSPLGLLMRGSLKKQIAADLADIKAHVEGRHSTG